MGNIPRSLVAPKGLADDGKRRARWTLQFVSYLRERAPGRGPWMTGSAGRAGRFSERGFAR